MEYTSKCGYNTGKEVLYSQFSINPTIKALRRTVYVPKKTLTRRLLNWLTPQGIAIWYMAVLICILLMKVKILFL